ncbi:MAG TPA: dihydroorotase [Deltaproteobacteria bacterium]|nr:dihydroorotase [Deltaproteobacteria bacterium]HIJ36462.1 dihydroorotase [Deltaproteobacteria bacterium]HIJ39917.1 dihydroorotase [Deltaproteobacteria bacterium]HIJ41560.1 dihydroorotase [Deltaproteobacteria bacterium]
MVTLIEGGNLVDPVNLTVERYDILVKNGIILKIIPPGAIRTGDRLKVIDASGKIVAPGLIDMHTHLREPGEEYKETIATGARAASAGGFTAVACMPNTHPPNDCRSVTEFILKQAERAASVRVYPIAAITMGQKGECLTDFGDLREAGAVGVSDDGFPVADSELMRRALEYSFYHGLIPISHCEDRSLSREGVMHEGAVSTRIGLPGIPGAGESIMVYREIALAGLTGRPVHIAHVSTAASVELIRRAKNEGIPVTAETAPHYFSLTHEAVTGYNTLAKVNPPLRTSYDVEAVRKGLTEGVIDVIATDHAPHSHLEKDVEFDKAAFGMVGFQTALPLTLQLVREGVMSMPEAVAKLTSNSARILGVRGGRLVEGETADLTIIDPEYAYLFEEKHIVSKSRNSPFIGMNLKGIAELTMVGGKIVWKRPV